MDHIPTNMELITPPQEKWSQPVRNHFKIIIQVQGVALPEYKIQQFQKQVEDLAVKYCKGGSLRWNLE